MRDSIRQAFTGPGSIRAAIADAIGAFAVLIALPAAWLFLSLIF